MRQRREGISCSSTGSAPGSSENKTRSEPAAAAAPPARPPSTSPALPWRRSRPACRMPVTFKNILHWRSEGDHPPSACSAPPWVQGPCPGSIEDSPPTSPLSRTPTSPMPTPARHPSAGPAQRQGGGFLDQMQQLAWRRHGGARPGTAARYPEKVSIRRKPACASRAATPPRWPARRLLPRPKRHHAHRPSALGRVDTHAAAPRSRGAARARTIPASCASPPPAAPPLLLPCLQQRRQSTVGVSRRRPPRRQPPPPTSPSAAAAAPAPARAPFGRSAHMPARRACRGVALMPPPSKPLPPRAA